MLEIWANEMLPKALKNCPKSNKSPNQVTLVKLSNKQRFFGFSVEYHFLTVRSYLITPSYPTKRAMGLSMELLRLWR